MDTLSEMITMPVRVVVQVAIKENWGRDAETHAVKEKYQMPPHGKTLPE